MKTPFSNAGTTCPTTMAVRSRTSCASRLLLLLLLAMPAVAQAEDYTYTTNAGTITITQYTGPGGAVTIPSTINGLLITSIGDNAFWTFNRSPTSVTIPNSVTNIGISAFRQCTRLTNVTILDSVTSIGVYAFADCTSLTRVTMGSGVTGIGSSAFANCGSLTYITIPDSVTSIETGAFAGCASLTNVVIPGSVTWIGAGPFFACPSLTAISVDALNSGYSSVEGVLFNKSQSTLIQYPGAKAGSYTILNGVISIGHLAFAFCRSLTSVTMPNGVTSIEGRAFLGCVSLTSVTIPNSVKNIGAEVFSECSSLTNVAIGDGVTSIEEQAFFHCTSLSSITIPNSVTNIGNSAFNSCESLTSLTVPDSVTSIGVYAFYACTSLTSFTVSSANSNFSSVDGVLLDKSQATLIQYPGGKVGGSYTIPNSVTTIGPSAFLYSSNLTGVYFQRNAPYPGPYVFDGDDSATVYYLPGTTGWDTTFGGRPTALWWLPYPLILGFGPSFGVQTNGFGFRISWATNISIVVEVCTNLANPIWSPAGTNALTDGWSYFSEPQWTNYPARFYRLRSP